MDDFPFAAIFEFVIYSLAMAVIVTQSFGYDVLELGIVTDKSLMMVRRFAQSSNWENKCIFAIYSVKHGKYQLFYSAWHGLIY